MATNLEVPRETMLASLQSPGLVRLPLYLSVCVSLASLPRTSHWLVMPLCSKASAVLATAA